MKSLVAWLAVSLFVSAEICRAEEGITYYVKLIRGTSEDKPPIPTCHRAAPGLVSALRPVWKWKGYWEICSRSVDLKPGRATRVHLENGREVEIDLSSPLKRKVTAYHDGAVMDRTTFTVGDRMTITGGDRDEHSAWFVVIYRQSPPSSKRQI